MVGSIKSRIAAFEDLALKSKSSSQLMAIKPPEEGFAASKNRSAIFGPGIKGKETSGYVPPPAKTERKYKQEKGDSGVNENLSVSKPTSVSSWRARHQPSSNHEVDKHKIELRGKDKVENISDGPVSLISVTSRDNTESTEDCHSVSPLSFQSEKVPSGGMRSMFATEEYNLDVINEENSSKGSNIDDKSKNEETNNMKGGGSYEGCSFDGQDEHSLNEEIFSDVSNEDDHGVDNEDFTPDLNSVGPSIEDREEYENFTLGSGESEEASDERPPKPSVMTNDINDLENAQEKDVFGNYKSDEASDEESFSEYLSNMRPIPSFSEVDARPDSGKEHIEKGNDYISGDEEDIELDDLSEKVDDDVLKAGGRTVLEILDTNFEYYSDSNGSSVERDGYVINDPGIYSGNDVDRNQQRNRSSTRIEHSASPIYYPIEDFKENDEDSDNEDFDSFDDETADDETGDLLGVNFEELSLMSEEKGMNSFNLSSNGGTFHSSLAKDIIKQNSLKISNGISSSNQRDALRGKNHMQYHREVDSSKDPYGIEKQKYPLTLIREEQSTVIDHVHNADTYVSSGQSIYYDSTHKFSKGSNNVMNDDLSQITESTYDAALKAGKWRMNHPQDNQTHVSHSDQSVMTYNFNDSANSSGIMPRTAKNGPIFRDRNSLSKTMKLNNSASTISEITDPLSASNRHKSKEGKRVELTYEINKLLTINNANSMSSDNNRLSSNHKQSSASPNITYVGKTTTPTVRRSDESTQRGRQQESAKSNSRSFSLRSLSPFRRLGSKKKIDKDLLKAQEEFRRERDQDRARSEARNMNINRTFSASSSTPGDILKEDEEREVSVPLVALSTSYDHSERKVPKKKFSLRSLSPFRRHRSKKKSKSRIVDPFDEGNGSF